MQSVTRCSEARYRTCFGSKGSEVQILLPRQSQTPMNVHQRQSINLGCRFFIACTDRLCYIGINEVKNEEKN